MTGSVMTETINLLDPQLITTFAVVLNINAWRGLVAAAVSGGEGS